MKNEDRNCLQVAAVESYHQIMHSLYLSGSRHAWKLELPPLQLRFERKKPTCVPYPFIFTRTTSNQIKKHKKYVIKRSKNKKKKRLVSLSRQRELTGRDVSTQQNQHLHSDANLPLCAHSLLSATPYLTDCLAQGFDRPGTFLLARTTHEKRERDRQIDLSSGR